VPDLEQAAFLGPHVGELHPARHLAGVAAQQVTFSWDEQPVCRKLLGHDVADGSPNFIFPTSPEADGHGEFSPQRVQQARGISPLTNRLLLEAGSARRTTSGVVVSSIRTRPATWCRS
jgi:hypothetical protein